MRHTRPVEPVRENLDYVFSDLLQEVRSLSHFGVFDLIGAILSKAIPLGGRIPREVFNNYANRSVTVTC